MSYSRTLWLLPAALLLAVPAAAAAEGSAVAGEQRATLSLRGVDLADPAARAMLERRIDRAAAEVCGVGSGGDQAERHRQMSCMVATGNAARADLARRAGHGTSGGLPPARIAGI